MTPKNEIKAKSSSIMFPSDAHSISAQNNNEQASTWSPGMEDNSWALPHSDIKQDLTESCPMKTQNSADKPAIGGSRVQRVNCKYQRVKWGQGKLVGWEEGTMSIREKDKTSINELIQQMPNTVFVMLHPHS